MDTYKNGIQLSFANDTALLTGVLRILMPIAYRFNPDLVFVYLENSICTAKSVLSIKCINHVLKLLCALANGNILLALEADSDLENMNESVNKIYDILLGESCESLSYQVPSEELQKDIKRQIELLKPNWDCFQFNEKLPH